MSISKFDLGRSISDLEGKNSKFRRIAFLRMATKNISVRFYRFPIKTVGGVRKSTKKCLGMCRMIIRKNLIRRNFEFLPSRSDIQGQRSNL